MSTSIKLNKDEHIKHWVSTGIPYRFLALSEITVQKKWYQFWLPKRMNAFATVEKKPSNG